MNERPVSLVQARIFLRSAGTLWWPDQALLCVSDLHLGKAHRMARRSGALVPPYDSSETLGRLDAEIDATGPATVVCLGDSFDDLAAADSLTSEEMQWLTRMMASRDWIWIEGNHDPGPVDLGGRHLVSLTVGALTFRHIAAPDAAPGEVSGHYHPKLRLRGIRHPCFLWDGLRLILPAFGAYTGGMDSYDPLLIGLMDPKALAIQAAPGLTCAPIAGDGPPRSNAPFSPRRAPGRAS